MKCGIKKDRKLNKNNTSGVRGVRFDKDTGLWVAQIMFQRKAHILPPETKSYNSFGDL